MRWVISDVWTKFDPNRVSHADIPEIARTVEIALNRSCIYDGMRYAVCYNSGSNSSDNDNDNVVSRVYSTDEQSLRSYEDASTFRFNPSADRSRDALDIGGDDVEGPCSTLSAINADRDQSRL